MARELTNEMGHHLSEEQIELVAKSSMFQSAIGDLLERAHTYDGDGLESKNIARGALEETRTDA
jgi:hypothetical protein